LVSGDGKRIGRTILPVRAVWGIVGQLVIVRVCHRAGKLLVAPTTSGCGGFEHILVRPIF
jgi:hypothetical protein